MEGRAVGLVIKRWANLGAAAVYRSFRPVQCRCDLLEPERRPTLRAHSVGRPNWFVHQL